MEYNGIFGWNTWMGHVRDNVQDIEIFLGHCSVPVLSTGSKNISIVQSPIKLLKSLKNIQNVFTHKNKPNAGQKKKPQPRAEKVLFFLSTE